MTRPLFLLCALSLLAECGELGCSRGGLVQAPAEASTLNDVGVIRDAGPVMALDSDVTVGGTIGRQFATKWGAAAHMFCQRQASRAGAPGLNVDIGEVPDEGFSCGVYGRGLAEDRILIRGIPMWQWRARCELWLQHEYEWPADSGVVLVP